MNKVRYNCPKCGSDNCSSFEMIYSHGTSDVQSQSVSIVNVAGHGALAATQGAGTQQSRLASICAPPVMKSGKAGCISIFISICCLPLIGICTFFLLLSSTSSDREILMKILLCSVLGIAGLVVYIGDKQKKANDFNNGPYILMLSEWKKKWMCLKCGNNWKDVD